MKLVIFLTIITLFFAFYTTKTVKSLLDYQQQHIEQFESILR